MLSPRNIRIQSDPNHRPELYIRPKAIWQFQQDRANARMANTDIQKQLEDDGLWMCKETATTTRRIERRIADLKLNHPEVESEWSVHFWQEFFFKRGNDSPSQLLKKCVERRQLHSESYRDAKGHVENDAEDRLPPVVANSRHSVPGSAEPWIMTKFNQRGYAFSDILYATTSPVDLTSADDIQRYPGIRLFPDSLHLAAGFTVEVKPLDPNGSIGKEEMEHAIRYSTLTASIMLHEELKLCYLASDDDNFFPVPDHLDNHFVAAVGYKAYHFIHCLRHPELNADVKYESYLLNEYDMRDATDRETFRQTMNLIYVYQTEILRNIELARLRKVLALDPEKRKHRLETRTHKYIRFSHEDRGTEWGFQVHDDSPDHQKSEHSATYHDAVEETAPSLDADNPPNSIDDLFQEEPVDVSSLNLYLPDANSKTQLAQGLDGAFEPHQEENAVMDIDGAMKVRRERKKLCGSTNTRTGKPCKRPSDGPGCHLAGHRVEL